MSEKVKVGDWMVEKSVFVEYLGYDKDAMDYLWNNKKTPSGTTAEAFDEASKCNAKANKLIRETAKLLGLEQTFKTDSVYQKFKLAFEIQAELIQKGKVKI